MPDHSEFTESAKVQHNESLSLLKSLQNADGGWGFHAGGQSRVEPSCWAALALFHSAKQETEESFRRLAGFLETRQLEDGSWPASPEMKTGGWVTSLACSVLAGDAGSEKQLRAGLRWICEDFPRDSSPLQRFMRRLRPESHISAQNDSYRGWGWTPKTSSWVEPTSFAVMALRAANAEQLPKNAGQRRELAISLLYDRMCPGGGWNCGNPRVYGVDGDALVLPTCWALLALRDAPEKPGRALSLAWLEKEFAKIESAGSLAVAGMTLENYGKRALEAKRKLSDWSAEDLAGDGTHVLAWVCMALDPARRWPGVLQQISVGAAR
jgi:hypothetical protein